MIFQFGFRIRLPLAIIGSVLAVIASGSAAPPQEKKDPKRFKSTEIELTDKAPADWILKEASIGTKMVSDKDYTLSEFPDAVKGGTHLLRSSGDHKTWLKTGTLRALKDTTVYALVRWKYLGKEVMDEVALTKFERDGWKEVEGETGTTFPDGEDWRWKTFKKQVKKGDVILQLKTVAWGEWAVLFIFK